MTKKVHGGPGAQDAGVNLMDSNYSRITSRLPKSIRDKTLLSEPKDDKMNLTAGTNIFTRKRKTTQGRITSRSPPK